MQKWNSDEPVSVTIRRAICILKAKRWIKGQLWQTSSTNLRPEDVGAVCALGATYLAICDPDKPISQLNGDGLTKKSEVFYSPAVQAMIDIPRLNDRLATTKEQILAEMERRAVLYEAKEAQK